MIIWLHSLGGVARLQVFAAVLWIAGICLMLAMLLKDWNKP